MFPFFLQITLKYFSERSKRRTKTLANTNHPRWNQSFVYSNVGRDELRQRVLEVTVWDYDRFGANEFLGTTLDQYNVLNVLRVCLIY